MPSNHLILCHPLLLPSIFPSTRVFSNESALRIRWPRYWSFSFSISLSNEYSGLISFRIDWFDLLAVQETLKSQTCDLEVFSAKSLEVGGNWEVLSGVTMTAQVSGLDTESIRLHLAVALLASSCATERLCFKGCCKGRPLWTVEPVKKGL